MIYLDTSALTKAYVPELASDEVYALLSTATETIALSSLSLLELRCALARRTRDKTLAEFDAQRVWSLFESDVADGAFEVLPVHDDDVLAAHRLIDQVKPLALKALDALHLAVAKRARVSRFSSADTQQIAAARALQMKVIAIGSSPL